MIKKFWLLLSTLLVFQVMEGVKLINNSLRTISLYFPNRAENVYYISLVRGIELNIADFDTFDAFLVPNKPPVRFNNAKKDYTIIFSWKDGHFVVRQTGNGFFDTVDTY